MKCPVCYGPLNAEWTCQDCGSTFTADLKYRLVKGGLQRMKMHIRRQLYRERVWELTMRHFPHHRGTWDRSIQHDVTIQRGFNRGIAALRIGSRENCRIITRRENIEIGTKVTPRGQRLEAKWAAEDGTEMGE